MIQKIYYAILSYFLEGGIGFYFINRNKAIAEAKKSYAKLTSYFFIINLVFFSIVINPVAFQYLSVLIIVVGYSEQFRLLYKSGYNKIKFYIFSLFIYSILSVGFFFFGTLEKEVILYSFILISVFDSFSQITGQLWGHIKLFPNTSPNKTGGGLIGGGLVVIFSAFLLKGLYSRPVSDFIVITFGLVIFSLAGDLAASFYKRKFGVKDYNNLIPGHGGFLDRFDSLIAEGRG